MHFEIDDAIFRDPRFMRLVAKVGDHEKAMGICLSAWIAAFDFWKQKNPIPRSTWVERGLSDHLIEVGLARMQGDDGVYVCGTERMCSWYHKAVEKGKKGGLKSQANRRSTARPKSTRAQPKQPPSPFPFPFPSTSTSTVPVVCEGGDESPPHGAVKPSRNPNPLNSITWDAYAEAYRQRYQTDPVRNETVNGQIANLVRRLGVEAPEVVRYYLTQNRAFYTLSCHPIGLCLKYAESLRTQWATGRQSPTLDTSRNASLVENAREQIAMIDRGEI